MSTPRTQAVAIALLVFAACSEPPTAPPGLNDVQLTVVSGGGQSGVAGQELPQPLVVRVTTANGKAVRGQLVNFRVTLGGGSMYAGAALTDMSGSAQDYWTLGPVRGTQQVDVVAVDPTTGAKQNFGTFTATALAPAALSITPATASFGTVSVGSTSASQTFTITNTGDETSGSVAVALTGASAADYSIVGNTCGGALAGGSTCTASVTFSPQATGTRLATLTATASLGGTATASLTGTGAAAAILSFSFAGYTFGSVLVGSTSSTQTFTITNTGGASALLLTLSITGLDPGDFFIAGTNCTGITLVPGQTCSGGVAFRPTAAGLRQALLTVSANGGGVTASAALSGTGISPASLSISPTAKDFGTVSVGSSSAPQTFTVTNVGQAVSGVLSTTITGANAQDFLGGANGCAGITLSVGQSCQVSVTFVPLATGARNANLSVAASPGGSAVATLTGTGSSPGASLTLAPLSQDFGSVAIGGSSSVRTFTATNTGGSPSGPLSVTITGPASSAFLAIADNCSGATLAAGASCTIGVSFMPTVLGAHSATLTVSASPGGTVSSTLSGTGVTAAQLTIGPPAADFGTQPVGLSTRATTFTIGNSGGATTGTISVSITGVNASDYQIVRDTCSGLSLGPSSSCEVDVVFTPNAVGTRDAALSVSATPGGSVSASLTGVGG